MVLIVDDGDGGAGNLGANVFVSNVAPTLTSYGVTSGPATAGSPVTLSATATDPAGVADPLTYTWTVFRPDNTSFALPGRTVSFTPETGGFYQYRVVVTDDDFGMTQWSGSISVRYAAPAVLAVPPAGAVYTGGPVAAAGTVTGASGQPGATLGGVGLTLTYYAGTAATGTGSPTPPVNAGTYTVVARFPGSADYPAAESAPATFTIGRATPTVAVTPPPSGVYTGQPFLATGSVAGVNGVAGATLEGLGVTLFYQRVGPTGPGQPIAAPRAAGTYVVSATYLGGLVATNYTTAGTPGATFTISPAVLTVAADADPATPAADGFVKTYGQADPAFTYRATGFVGADTAAGILTGAPARAAGDAAGQYAVTQGTLASGSGNYTVAFTPGSLTVRQAASAVALAASAPVTVPGLAVTFSAAVTPGATGTVTFRDGTTVLGTVPVTNGVARLTTDALTYGDRAITATYSGDTNHAAPPAAGVTESVVRAAILPDALNPGQNALFVGGTPGADLIGVARAGTDKYTVGLRSGGQPDWTGSFAGAVSRVVVYGGAGNDGIGVDADVTRSAWVYGGAGNDVLVGGGGHDLLMGGVGADRLFARGGTDILIGGAGADELSGGAGGDLLVAGTTAFDLNEVALNGVQLEWTSGRTYEQRVANLRGTGTGPRLNGDFFLKASGAGKTVSDDGAADTLRGGSGRDWFIANRSGGVTDTFDGLGGNEWVDELN